MITIAFGHRIKAWRADRGWTQQQLADKAGVSMITVHNVEKVATPDKVAAPTIAGLARAFGCSSETLITGTGAPPVPPSAQQDNSGASSVRETQSNAAPSNGVSQSAQQRGDSAQTA